MLTKSPFIDAGGVAAAIFTKQGDKVVAVMSDGRVGAPCGACREYMMQLDKNSGDIEILLDLESEKTVKLKELIPDWWGYDRFEE